MENCIETYLLVYKAICRRDYQVLFAVRSKDEIRCFSLIDNLFHMLFRNNPRQIFDGNLSSSNYSTDIFHVCELIDQNPRFEIHMISRNKDKYGEIMYSSQTSHRPELAQELLNLPYMVYIKNR